MLEFGGAPGQWARYGRWEAGSVGELSFSLKTNTSKALVLYLDDGGNCDFLELLIAGGRLQLRFAIHCAEPATLHMETGTVKYEPPFQGLISNLKVGEMPPTLLNSQGIQSDLEYLCTKQNPCFNGGFCSIQYGEVHCDCTHTRFKGKYCKEDCCVVAGSRYRCLALG
ncbi:hypothetical protein D5F01_LYC22477 [Larimichthys crocea]|uniref:EGF-like domain-containing protein n=1 Tax=Larimichthys crocea TaxID=215358 RepID=A0A6G0HIM8_LARCR|nr:hypothetical protein D5F01_LYC22477 [Larimichthys crocea]